MKGTIPEEYYFWKWAENDLPGKPADVYASLIRGQFHPALQSFDARPLLACLTHAAAEGRPLGEEWDWQVHPTASPRNARFVFATGPSPDILPDPGSRLESEFLHLGLTMYEESKARLVKHFPPKLNSFESGQFPVVYDITPDDLPILLKQIHSSSPDPFGILTNSRSDFVQLYVTGRRFCVEWHEEKGGRPYSGLFTQWRAQDRKRLAALDIPYHRNISHGKDPDLLLYSEALRIFETFLSGGRRPAGYHWMNINSWIKKPRKNTGH